MWIIGRLKPGMTLVGAQAESTTLGKQLESQYPERNAMDPRLVPLRACERTSKTGSVRARVRCRGNNVDCVRESFNLQLARLGARQKEIATRAALGAGR